MNCLIIDTSTDLCLIAIAKNNQIISENVFSHQNLLSKNLLPAIQHLLQEVGLNVSDLNLVAVGIGPGSYTGTRVGAAIGKTLAFGLNIEVIPFCSPLAFLPDRDGSFAFLLPARSGDYFVLQGSSSLREITQKSAALLSPDAMITATETADFLICTSMDSLPEKLKEKLHIKPSVNLPALTKYLKSALPLAPEHIELKYLHTPY